MTGPDVTGPAAPSRQWVRPRHLLPHATFGDDPSGYCGCAECDPRETCGCQSCRRTDGLGVIWTCDNCQVVTETGLDDEPAGWLIEEPDEDDSPEDEDVPIDLILCAGCRFPDVVIPPEPEPTP